MRCRLVPADARLDDGASIVGAEPCGRRVPAITDERPLRGRRFEIARVRPARWREAHEALYDAPCNRHVDERRAVRGPGDRAQCGDRRAPIFAQMKDQDGHVADVVDVNADD